jgi:cell division protein FtsW (lipid II flippase)
MSYGGSSVIMTLIAIGILQSIHVQGKGAMQTKARELL